MTADVAAVQAAITAQEDLQNGVTIAMATRDTARSGLRNRLLEFRKAVEYRLKNSGFDRSLPDSPQESSSVQKLLQALDDMASIWARVNAASGVPNFTPPLLLLGGYALATFQADTAALRAKFLAVTEAENDARMGRKMRDKLLDPLRDRLVQYRQGIVVEYGEEHVFTQTLPDVYETGGGGGAGGGAPAAPGAPTLEALAGGQVRVTWALVAGAQFYILQKLLVGTDTEWQTVGNVGPAGQPAMITSLPPDETIQVRLIAANAAGQSEPGPHAEIETIA